MNKLFRIIVGLILIAIGIAISIFGISLWPQPFTWGGVLIGFLPAIAFTLAFIALGIGTIRGMSKDDIIEYVMFLWR